MMFIKFKTIINGENKFIKTYIYDNFMN